MWESLQHHGLQNVRLHHLPVFAQIHVHWVGDAIWPSHPLSPPYPFSFHLSQQQDLFQCQLFTSGGHSIGASASALVLPMNIQDWFPLELTGLIFLQSKGLSRVFSSTTIWKHQFFSTQPSLWFNSHIHTWLPEKKNYSFDYMDLCWQSDVPAF